MSVCSVGEGVEGWKGGGVGFNVLSVQILFIWVSCTVSFTNIYFIS